jgi:predicted short-subunit dehydrogenase-like oxidoreductase (DUF2520 family)
MRQVPANSTSAVKQRVASPLEGAHYLVIGDGRLARHLCHYLKLENLPFDQWSRKQAPIFLKTKADRATHVFIAISDGAIEPFLETHSFLMSRVCVHFSGALFSKVLPGAHPLMTFGPELYELDAYRAIPFVLERGRQTLADLLPDFSNQSFEIEAGSKPLYHALCAMSGNFTVLLWEKVFAKFSTDLGLPQDILYPYLAQVASNLIKAPAGESVLTGPLARADFATIDKHLAALGNDPYADVYRAFVTAYLKPVTPAPTPFPLGGLV